MTEALPEKFIQDIKECVLEIRQEYQITDGSPITDDNHSLLRLCAKLEYLLQHARRERNSLFGSGTDYWRFFCQGLSSIKGIRDGLKFVKANTEVKTSAGRARAFVRYCLMHHCLADALQHCFSNERLIRKYFYERSILTQERFWTQLVGVLYELNDITFSLDPISPDLDIGWPSLSRHSEGASGGWEALSRSSSLTSLVSQTSKADSFITSKDDISIYGSENPFMEDVAKKEQEYQNLIKEMEDELHLMKEKFLDDRKALEAKCQTLEEALLSKPTYSDCMTQTDQNQSLALHSLITAHSQIAELEAQNDQLRQDKENLQKEKETLLSHSNSLSQKVEDLFNELESAKTELIKMKEEAERNRDKYQTKNDSTMEILKAMEVENRRMKLFRADALEEIATLKNKLEESENKNSILHSQTNGIILSEPSALGGDSPTRDHNSANLDFNNNDLNLLIQHQESLLRLLENRFNKSHDETVKLKCQTDLLADMLSIAVPKENSINNNQSESESLRIPKLSCQSEDNSLINHFNSNNSRLEKLVSSTNTLYRDLIFTSHLNRIVVDKVKEKEKHLFEITQDLEATQKLVHSLKSEHKKLQSASLIMKDELKEKRKFLTKLKKQLESTHENWQKVRIKNMESLSQWQNLRDEFSQRQKQNSEESGFVDESKEGESICSSPAPDSLSEDPSLSAPSTSMAASEGGSKGPKRSLSDRLECLEAQYKLLYISLVQSSQKSALLDKRLENILGNSSSEDATPTPPEIPESEVIDIAESGESLEEPLGSSDEEGDHLASPDESEKSEETSDKTDDIPLEELDIVDLRRKAARKFLDNLKMERELSSAKEADLTAKIKELKEENENLKEQISKLTEQKNILLQKNGEYKKRVEFIFKQEREQSSAAQIRLREEREKLEKLVSQMKHELDEKAQVLEELNTLISCTQTEAASSQQELESLSSQLDTEKRRRSEDLETMLELDKEREATKHLSKELQERESAMLNLDKEVSQLRSDILQLKKKVVQLIKEKDLLWQRSDKLSYLQRIQASDRWMEDNQAKQCIDCHASFTFILRRHHCRICGRIFCYNCSNNWVFISSSKRRSRVCNECFTTQSEIKAEAEKLSSSLLVNIQEAGESAGTTLDESLSSCSSISPLSPSPVVYPPMMEQSPPSDGDVKRSSPVKFSESPNEEGIVKPQASSLRHLKAEDEFAVISDAEIVKSLSSCSPYTTGVEREEDHPGVEGNLATVTSEDLLNNGSVQGQVWIAPNRSCSLPVLCHHTSTSNSALALCWDITAEPQGISFQVTFKKEGENGEEEVLLAPTHFLSQDHALEGRLTIDSPGIYTLIFNNSLSQIMVRKVKYKITLEEEQLHNQDVIKAI